MKAIQLKDRDRAADIREVQLSCLVHLAKADSVLKSIETRTITAIMEATGIDARKAVPALGQPGDPDVSALRELTPLAKQQFMKMLWLLALCDGTLHAAEEETIYRIGDMIGVERRSMTEIERYVATCFDRDGLLATA